MNIYSIFVDFNFYRSYIGQDLGNIKGNKEYQTFTTVWKLNIWVSLYWQPGNSCSSCQDLP